jgi:uncharacterized protein YndB with AHSA1/START domain
VNQPEKQTRTVVIEEIFAHPPEKLWRALTEPAEGGTHLRMEHSGFRATQEAAYQGAQHGWQRFIGNLERLLDEEVQ